MKALVTGGAGFIGSHLVDKLVSEGHPVVVVDDFSHGKKENLDSARKLGEVKIYEENINTVDFDWLLREEEPEVIFNLAAQIDVRQSVSDPIEDAITNVVGVVRMADAARRHSVRKIVHASSGGSIYGIPDQLPVGELAQISPESPYAASKFCGEVYLRMFRRLYGLQSTYIAPANVYGPRQDPHGEAGVVSIFVQSMLENETTRLFGEANNTRDYVFVTDVANAFFLAGGEKGDGERFNIGTGVETTDSELHKKIATAIGYRQKAVREPARLGDVPRSALNFIKAEQKLGWYPITSLEQGIEKTVAYFREGQSRL